MTLLELLAGLTEALARERAGLFVAEGAFARVRADAERLAAEAARHEAPAGFGGEFVRQARRVAAAYGDAGLTDAEAAREALYAMHTAVRWGAMWLVVAMLRQGVRPRSAAELFGVAWPGEYADSAGPLAAPGDERQACFALLVARLAKGGAGVRDAILAMDSG